MGQEYTSTHPYVIASHMMLAGINYEFDDRVAHLPVFCRNRLSYERGRGQLTDCGIKMVAEDIAITLGNAGRSRAGTVMAEQLGGRVAED